MTSDSVNENPPNDVSRDLVIPDGVGYLEEDEEEGEQDLEGESCQDEDPGVDGGDWDHDEGEKDDETIERPDEDEAGEVGFEIGKVGGSYPEDQDWGQLGHPPDHLHHVVGRDVPLLHLEGNDVQDEEDQDRVEPDNLRRRQADQDPPEDAP